MATFVSQKQFLINNSRNINKQALPVHVVSPGYAFHKNVEESIATTRDEFKGKKGRNSIVKYYAKPRHLNILTIRDRKASRTLEWESREGHI